MSSEEIIALLPYKTPFLFVDHIEELGESYIIGTYTFSRGSFFYEGHFKNNPITPGVILTECMAQIGLVSLGISKLEGQDLAALKVAFTSADVEFLKPVMPGEKVTVVSEEAYFRFNKLKCNVKLLNAQDEVCVQGTLAGIFSTK